MSKVSLSNKQNSEITHFHFSPLQLIFDQCYSSVLSFSKFIYRFLGTNLIWILTKHNHFPIMVFLYSYKIAHSDVPLKIKIIKQQMVHGIRKKVMVISHEKEQKLQGHECYLGTFVSFWPISGINLGLLGSFGSRDIWG